MGQAVRARSLLLLALIAAPPALSLRSQGSASGLLAAAGEADRSGSGARSSQTGGAWTRKYRNGGVPDKAHAQLPLKGGRFAVIISGLRSRLVLNSTLEHVVSPAARLGYRVDVYLSLVQNGDGVAFTSHGLSDPDIAAKTSEELEKHIEGAVAAAGGHLAHYTHRKTQEVVDTFPSDPVHREYMYDYTPSQSAFGLNVLRRWKSSEELLNETLRQPAGYDFLLWEREDQYWFKPLWLFNFHSGAESINSVYAKNCLGWGGINDKSLLMGREAARKLMTAYSSFWAGDRRLRSRNAEQYLSALAALRGLRVRRVPFAMIPSSDASFAKLGDSAQPELCVKDFYSCTDEPPKGSPPFCPAMK